MKVERVPNDRIEFPLRFEYLQQKGILSADLVEQEVTFETTQRLPIRLFLNRHSRIDDMKCSEKRLAEIGLFVYLETDTPTGGGFFYVLKGMGELPFQFQRHARRQPPTQYIVEHCEVRVGLR